MSVDLSVYLVDWVDFQERVLQAEPYDVLEDFESEPISDTNAAAPIFFLEIFEVFERRWRSDERLYFRDVFDSLFGVMMHRKQIMELRRPTEHDLDGIDTALGPATVAELVEMTGRIDLEHARLPFEEHVRDCGRFQSFDGWKRYAEEWFTLLRRGSASGKGLLIVIFA